MRAASPLLVDYPFGGRRFVLHWWTYDERGHLVIAESEQSLLSVSKRVFADNPDAEIKAMWEIEIVAPSERFETLAKECARLEGIAFFHMSACHRVQDVMEAGLPIPPPFALCEEFARSEDDAPADSWARETHFCCINCNSRIRLVGMTPEELHARYAEEWYALYPDERPHVFDQKKMKSRAPLAKDDDDLWYACSIFGHHASGIELREVDVEKDVYLVDRNVLTPNCFSADLMFFFKKLRELDRSEAEAVLAAESDKAKKQRDELEQSRRKEFEREKRERNESIVRFFKERAR